MNEAAEAVRRYLLFLEDPESLRDEAALAEAQARVDAASDPLEKLAALAERERIAAVDGEHVRRAFVQHARAYASHHDIPASAFAALGVPAVDLRDAGLTGGGRGGAGRAPRARSSSRRRVGQDEVREVVLSLTDPFSIRSLADAAGTTQQTATKVVRAMEQDGTVVSVGPDREFAGRGKPPVLYRVK